MASSTETTVAPEHHADALVPRIEPGSSVKLIGLGGVGGIVARYVSLFLASLGVELRFVLMDGDTFEPGNSTRMVFASFANKAAVTRDELLAFLAGTRLTLAAVEEHVDESNIERLVREGDTIMLAVDNHATRKLVSDYCATLNNVRLISGGNDGVEERPDGKLLRGTFGNCQVYVRRDGIDVTPSLSEYHAEIAEPVDRLPTDLSCIEAAATSAPQILFANLQTATAMLSTLWLCLCDRLHYSEVCFDIAEGLMRPVKHRQ